MSGPARWLWGACAASLVGCATTTPPVLSEARRAYVSASAGLAATMAPLELEDARTVLERANLELRQHGDTLLARDYAYIARRKIELANSRARTLVDQMIVAESQREAEALRERTTAGVELEVQPSAPQPGEPEQPREGEEGQRPRPGAPRIAGALGQVAEVEDVLQDGRGVVIVMPFAELFSTGTSELTEGAKARLERVAEALRGQTYEKQIVVEGHTDDLGTDASLRALSETQARAVREFLITCGVETRKITAVGRGGSRPRVNNTSPENRAANRRVEIVIQPGSLTQR